MKNLTNLLENFKNYEEKLNKSTKTIEGYLKEARYFIKDYNINSIEDLKIMENKEFWEQWLEDMTSKYQAGTVNKKKTALSVFSKFLIFQEIIETNKINYYYEETICSPCCCLYGNYSKPLSAECFVLQCYSRRREDD